MEIVFELVVARKRENYLVAVSYQLKYSYLHTHTRGRASTHNTHRRTHIYIDRIYFKRVENFSVCKSSSRKGKTLIRQSREMAVDFIGPDQESVRPAPACGLRFVQTQFTYDSALLRAEKG